MLLRETCQRRGRALSPLAHEERLRTCNGTAEGFRAGRNSADRRAEGAAGGAGCPLQGKIAEREIFLRKALDEAAERGEGEEVEKIRQQMVNERARLEDEREAEKEKVRRARVSGGDGVSGCDPARDATARPSRSRRAATGDRAEPGPPTRELVCRKTGDAGMRLEEGAGEGLPF
jgi:hypothetical protein